MLQKIFTSTFEAGTDEAGRGCLAGPVTAAVVILPNEFENEILNDSKLLSVSKRNILRKVLENEALSFAVTHVQPEEIDTINILNASILAMHRSLDKLKKAPEFIIVDGNKFHGYKNIPYQCIVKGDSKFLSIAAASVLAKTHRDEYMIKLHQEYPMYNWAKNKGYPTKEHRLAIQKYGLSPYHRKSFKQLPTQLELDM